MLMFLLVCIFQELSKERQKCLETLLYIAEIEEYYQVSLIYLSEIQAFNSGTLQPEFILRHAPQKHLADDCIGIIMVASGGGGILKIP